MVKMLALVGLAAMAFGLSGFGLHQAGWFGGTASRAEECQEFRPNDPMASEAAMRFRNGQYTSWRQVLTVR